MGVGNDLVIVNVRASAAGMLGRFCVREQMDHDRLFAPQQFDR